MNYFRNTKRYYSVLTNGVTELEIICSRYNCGINPGSHIIAQDGLGHIYIDGLPAHIEIREEK